MAATFPLKISHPKEEGTPAFSKWIHLPLLLSIEELASLFAIDAQFYPMGRVVSFAQVQNAKTDFLHAYGKALKAIEEGRHPEEELSFGVSVEADALYAMNVGEDRYLIRQKKPIIQIKKHQFSLSVDGSELLQNVCGDQTTPWGIQVSFPMLFRDPQTVDVIQSKGANTVLFRAMQKWVRTNTAPATLLMNGAKKKVPLRLGKTFPIEKVTLPHVEVVHD